MSFPNNLQPWALLSRAFATSREGFVASVGDLKLLAVRTGKGTGELEKTLMEIAGRATVPWHPRGASTGVTSVAPISDGFLAAVAAASQRREATPQILRSLLGQGAFYVLPLAKRQDASSERVTIGRSGVNDVVLRHDSVSVHHAWIEIDDRSLLYLSDEGSTNGTQINGRTLDAGEMAPLESGDSVRFGEVQCILVDPGDYWDLVTRR